MSAGKQNAKLRVVLNVLRLPPTFQVGFKRFRLAGLPRNCPFLSRGYKSFGVNPSTDATIKSSSSEMYRKRISICASVDRLMSKPLIWQRAASRSWLSPRRQRSLRICGPTMFAGNILRGMARKIEIELDNISERI
jgi:hypothetical protein